MARTLFESKFESVGWQDHLKATPSPSSPSESATSRVYPAVTAISAKARSGLKTSGVILRGVPCAAGDSACPNLPLPALSRPLLLLCSASADSPPHGASQGYPSQNPLCS
eukprot:757008-Hanusia_phi.AAC.1